MVSCCVWSYIAFADFFFPRSQSLLLFLLYMQCIQEDHEEPNASIPTLRYYLIPCFFFFDRSHKLLDLVLKMMGSLITDSSSSLFSPKYATDCSSRINAIVSVLVLMHKDVKVQQIISSLKSEIDHILRKILSFQVQFCTSKISLSMS